MVYLKKVRTDKELTKLYYFFKKLPDNSIFTTPFKRYKQLVANYSYVLYNNKDVIGGLSYYHESDFIAVLNFYAIHDKVNFSILRQMVSILVNASNSSCKKVYMSTTTPHKLSSTILTHIRDDVYELKNPKARN